MEPQTHRRGGERFARADTVTGEMVVSDRRAIADGEMDMPTAANGPREEAAVTRNMEVMFWWWGGGR